MATSRFLVQVGVWDVMESSGHDSVARRVAVVIDGSNWADAALAAISTASYHLDKRFGEGRGRFAHALLTEPTLGDAPLGAHVVWPSVPGETMEGR